VTGVTTARSMVIGLASFGLTVLILAQQLPA
jgi:hypothetical protein